MSRLATWAKRVDGKTLGTAAAYEWDNPAFQLALAQELQDRTYADVAQELSLHEITLIKRVRRHGLLAGGKRRPRRVARPKARVLQFDPRTPQAAPSPGAPETGRHPYRIACRLLAGLRARGHQVYNIPAAIEMGLLTETEWCAALAPDAPIPLHIRKDKRGGYGL